MESHPASTAIFTGILPLACTMVFKPRCLAARTAAFSSAWSNCGSVSFAKHCCWGLRHRAPPARPWQEADLNALRSVRETVQALQRLWLPMGSGGRTVRWPGGHGNRLARVKGYSRKDPKPACPVLWNSAQTQSFCE